MKMLRNVILGATALLMASSSPVWAKGGDSKDYGQYKNYGQYKKNIPAANKTPAPVQQAPEIDAASGTSAIALTTGLVLMMRERSRSRNRKEG